MRKNLFEQFMEIQDDVESTESEVISETTLSELLEISDFHNGRVTGVYEDDRIGWLIEGSGTVSDEDGDDIEIGYAVNLTPTIDDKHIVEIILFPKEDGIDSDEAVETQYEGTLEEIRSDFSQTSYLEDYIYGSIEDEESDYVSVLDQERIKDEE